MAGEAKEVPSGSPRQDRRRVAAQNPEARRKFRIAMALVGLFGVLVVGILIAGYIIIFVRPPSELVVRVNDVSYDRGDMVKLLRIRQKSIEFLGGTFNAGEDVFQGLQLLVENEIISQSAPSFGINISKEEVDNEIRGIILQNDPSTLSVPKDQLEREFQERYRAYLNTLQISDSEHRELVRRSLLREQFRQFIGDSVPTVAEQVHTHRILVNPANEVDIMLVKLRDAIGESTEPEDLQAAFASIAREFSTDAPELLRVGGDLGWVPSGVYIDYDYAFFNLEIGKISEAVPNVDVNDGKVYFYMVSERSAAREIDAATRDVLKTRALQDWLNRQRDNFDVYDVFNSDIYNWILQQLQLTTTFTPEPQQPTFQNPFTGF